MSTKLNEIDFPSFSNEVNMSSVLNLQHMFPLIFQVQCR
jgi:hypothetical protein